MSGLPSPPGKYANSHVFHCGTLAHFFFLRLVKDAHRLTLACRWLPLLMFALPVVRIAAAELSVHFFLSHRHCLTAWLCFCCRLLQKQQNCCSNYVNIMCTAKERSEEVKELLLLRLAKGVKTRRGERERERERETSWSFACICSCSFGIFPPMNSN